MVQRYITVYTRLGQAVDEVAEQDVCCKVPQTCTALKPNVLRIDVMQTISSLVARQLQLALRKWVNKQHLTKLTSLKTVLF